MSNLVAPAKTRPWYMMNYPRSGRNPFDSIGRDYCLFCKQDVDVDTEAHQHGTTYAYRRLCCRCGRPINWGCIDRVAVLEGPTPSSIRAFEWVRQRGQDRS